MLIIYFTILNLNQLKKNVKFYVNQYNNKKYQIKNKRIF